MLFNVDYGLVHWRSPNSLAHRDANFATAAWSDVVFGAATSDRTLKQAACTCLIHSGRIAWLETDDETDALAAASALKPVRLGSVIALETPESSMPTWEEFASIEDLALIATGKVPGARTADRSCPYLGDKGDRAFPGIAAVDPP